MIIGTKRKITREEIVEELNRVKEGCGVPIGVPILVKFKPCGETYGGKDYFCNGCKHRLSLWETYLWFFEKGIQSSSSGERK